MTTLIAPASDELIMEIRYDLEIVPHCRICGEPLKLSAVHHKADCEAGRLAALLARLSQVEQERDVLNGDLDDMAKAMRELMTTEDRYIAEKAHWTATIAQVRALLSTLEQEHAVTRRQSSRMVAQVRVQLAREVLSLLTEEPTDATR